VFRTLMLSLVALLYAASAHAQAVSLLATGPLVGDGVTPATLRVWVEGTTVTDRVRLNPAEGRAGDPVLSADGVVAFSYVPPAVTSAKQIAIDVSVRGAVKVDRRVEVPVSPPARTPSRSIRRSSCSVAMRRRRSASRGRAPLPSRPRRDRSC
jgi:hypothetical protein